MSMCALFYFQSNALNAWHSGRRTDSIRHNKLHLSSLLKMRAFYIALRDYHMGKKLQQNLVNVHRTNHVLIFIQQRTKQQTLTMHMHMLFNRINNVSFGFLLSCVNREMKQAGQQKNSTISYTKSIVLILAYRPVDPCDARAKQQTDLWYKSWVSCCLSCSQVAAFGQCKRWKRRKLCAGVPLWLLVFF